MARGQPGTATAVVNVRVRPGHDEEFLKWQNKINEAVSQFDGFISTDIVTPANPLQDDFVILYQFASAWQLKQWMDSPARQRLLDQIAEWTEGGQATNVVMGGTTSQTMSKPVTGVITVRIRAGSGEQYREWQDRMTALMAKQKGYLGSNVQEPITGLQDSWVIMTKFDSDTHLTEWLESKKRANMLAEIEPIVESSSVRHARTSFDGWFPFANGQRPPRAWQQSALVLLVLFPVVSLEVIFLNPLLKFLLSAPATFVGNLISVSLTGFILIPVAASAFRFWLVPGATRLRLWVGSLILIVLYAVTIAAMQFLFDRVNETPFYGVN